MTDFLNAKNDRFAAVLAQNYAVWEKRLRGWEVFDYAVNLEPAFSHLSVTQPLPVPVRDDARLPNGWQRLFARNQNTDTLRATNTQRLSESNEQSSAIPNPAAFYRTENLTEFEILLSPDLDVPPVLNEQFFLSLDSSGTAVSFEILADAEKIKLLISCDQSYALHLKNQLETFFPSCPASEKQALLAAHINHQPTTVIADFGLARNFLLPLQIFRNFNPDPLTGLVSSLGNLQAGEKALFQVLFQKARFGWAEETQKIFSNPNFKSLQSSQVPAIREKFSSPLVAAVIRLAVQSGTKERSWEVLRRIGGNFSPVSSPAGNELVALANNNYPVNNHFLSLFSRTSYRSGMILNVAELTSIAHLPASSVNHPKLKRAQTNTKAVPSAALNHSFVLGINEYQGVRREATLSSEERMKHTHLIGASGSGKSTLLIRMMIQDAEQGNGFCAIDPHGDLIDLLAERIPESRLKDVILFDPADEDFPVGFNILSAHSELEKTLLASDLVSIFRRFSTSWGDVMNSVLANTVLAFLESKRGGNLIELKRFLIDRNFREHFLKSVEDEEIRRYWQSEFPLVKGKPFAPLLTRLDTFLRSKLIRHIVAQKENRLDFRRIMDERKILLVRLSLGAIGEENAYLLGSLLVSKLYQAALSRQNIAEEARPPFFLYLDEAHHFVAESINRILTGVRKYKLGLVLAHQQLRQFQAGEADILASVLSNCYTRACFRLDDTDAERLAKGFSFFTAEHLKNLAVGEAIVRFEQSRFDFNLRTFPLGPVNLEIAEKRRKIIIEQSRKYYAKTKSEVEAENQTNSHSSNVIIPAKTGQDSVTENARAEAAQESQKNPVSEVSDNFAQINNGRGGRHHQELQAVIGRMATSYGFSVEIEKSILEGAANVDVSIEKENLRIACEVSVTSTTEYETKSVLKCLAVGYDYALVVVSNQKKLPALNARLRSGIPIEQLDKVKAFGLSGLLAFLRELTVPKDTARKNSEKPAGQRLSFTEACEFFGVGASTLYRWIREGRVPFYRPGREYQFDRDELVLTGKHDLSGKRKTAVKLEPLKIEKATPKNKKEQHTRYRKLLKLD